MSEDTADDIAAQVAAIDTELAKILSMLATAHRLIDENRIVDLNVLEARTRTLCEAVLDLPKLEAHEFTPKLQDLLAQLDNLASAMHARFGDLPVMPNHSAATAAGAYADMLKHFP
jgi:hypothetical protein